MIVDLLIVAAAAAFAISLIERWFSLDWGRGVVAMAVTTPGVILVFDYSNLHAIYMSVASSFVALVMVLGAERLATEPPILVDSRR